MDDPSQRPACSPPTTPSERARERWGIDRVRRIDPARAADETDL
jgi:hypothetical protein